MKKPRLEDFDPNAAPPLGSPIDSYPPIERPTSGVRPSVPQDQLPVSAPVPPLERPEQSYSATVTAEPMTRPIHDVNMSSFQEQPIKRTKELSFERTEERKNERKKIHHSFDVFSDQLMSLKELVLVRERAFGRRIKLSELVQEALDMFITKERNKE
jgi:hypothetical protein